MAKFDDIPRSYFLRKSLGRPLTSEEAEDCLKLDIAESVAGLFMLLSFAIVMPLSFFVGLILPKVRNECLVYILGEEHRSLVEEGRWSPQEHITKPLINAVRSMWKRKNKF